MMKGSVQQARDLGLFVASLRARIGLSLETLASLVGSSKSTLCRLENGQMPLPARGKNRMLLIALALVLCSAASERDRVLSLASIDPGLLGFEELIKLGLWPPASSNTKSAHLLSWEDLEQSREEVERVLRQLEAWMREPAVQQAEQASLQLRRKAARYRALLEELEQQLTRSQPDQGLNMQTGRLPLHEQSKILSAPGLFALASEKARWLMEQAGVERFAVDDCIVLSASEGFKGWERRQIQITTLAKPWPLPDDLAAILTKQQTVLDEHALNAPHYQLVAMTPAWSDLDCLKLVLAPLRFNDYAALLPVLDEPLLSSHDGRSLSIREKYGSAALYARFSYGNAALIPAPVSIQCLLQTQDERLVLVQP